MKRNFPAKILRERAQEKERKRESAREREKQLYARVLNCNSNTQTSLIQSSRSLLTWLLLVAFFFFFWKVLGRSFFTIQVMDKCLSSRSLKRPLALSPPTSGSGRRNCSSLSSSSSSFVFFAARGRTVSESFEEKKKREREEVAWCSTTKHVFPPLFPVRRHFQLTPRISSSFVFLSIAFR